MSSILRETYLQAAEVALRLVVAEAVARRWSEPSVLAGMSVGELAAHLARSVLQVDWYLDAPVGDVELTSAVEYYAQLQDTTAPASQLNTGVRARSGQTAADGPGAVAEQVGAAYWRLEHRLRHEPTGRRIAVVHRAGQELLLDEYLRTRCVEFAVHIEDLALSVASDLRAPQPAVAVAVEVLVGAARQRHGDCEVLHALARRERDAGEALRVV